MRLGLIQGLGLEATRRRNDTYGRANVLTVSNSFWTIAGVAIGAVLGGFAQVVNAWLQDARTANRDLREERRRAYVGVVGTSTQLRATLTQRWRHEAPADAATTNRVNVELADARRAQAQVRLVGPSDTADAATSLWSTLNDYASSSDAESDLDLRTSAFVKLAQRDLDIPVTEK